LSLHKKVILKKQEEQITKSVEAHQADEKRTNFL